MNSNPQPPVPPALTGPGGDSEPVCVQPGRPPAGVPFCESETGTKNAKAALRETEYFLTKSQEVARLGFYQFEIAANRWKCTPVLDEIFGIDGAYPRTSDSWLQLVVPEEREEMRKLLLDYVLAGHERFERECRIKRPNDGQIRWVNGMGELEFDPQGRPVRMIGMIQDVTDRKQAERLRREAEGLYRTVFQTSPDGIALLDLESRITFSSPKALEVMGFAAMDAVSGRPMTDFIAPEDHARVRAAFERVQNGRYRSSSEYIVRRPDGSTFIGEFNAALLRDTEGRPKGVLVIMRDTTERKQAEQARLEMERRLLHAQKLESLGVLAGGIAHDFNNLLMAILGNLDLALMDLSPVSPARTSIEQSVVAARRATDLTRQMLAYSGKASFDIRKIDLSELVAENAHLFRACISKRVVLNVSLDRGLPLINADSGQIQQIVMNLITNASEAIAERPGAITLSTGVQTCDEAALSRSRVTGIPQPGRFVFLEVADTGCGMDHETQLRLFDPFFTTKMMGRGLGMSATLGIVRAHNGAIFVDSMVGRGSTIRVLFPAGETVPIGTGQGAVAETLSTAPGGAPADEGTILIVDDEDMVRNVCARILRRLGWQVFTASNGPDALEIYRKNPSEITGVILDQSMPEMDGIAVCRELQIINPAVKVILSSGYSNEQKIGLNSETAGLAGFIQKPYTIEVLRNEIARVFKPAG